MQNKNCRFFKKLNIEVMAGPRTEGQTLIAFACDEQLLREIDEARRMLGETRSQFIRRALATKLDLGTSMIAPPDRAGKGGRPTHRTQKSSKTPTKSIDHSVVDARPTVPSGTRKSSKTPMFIEHDSIVFERSRSYERIADAVEENPFAADDRATVVSSGSGLGPGRDPAGFGPGPGPVPGESGSGSAALAGQKISKPADEKYPAAANAARELLAVAARRIREERLHPSKSTAASTSGTGGAPAQPSPEVTYPLPERRGRAPARSVSPVNRAGSAVGAAVKPVKKPAASK